MLKNEFRSRLEKDLRTTINASEEFKRIGASDNLLDVITAKFPSSFDGGTEEGVVRRHEGGKVEQ